MKKNSSCKLRSRNSVSNSRVKSSAHWRCGKDSLGEKTENDTEKWAGFTHGTGFLHFRLQIWRRNSVKIACNAPKIDFYGKSMKLSIQELKSLTGDFRAVYGYFAFSHRRCHFFAHLRQNKPKSLFCPIQERRKPGERGKNGTKVRFSRIFCR